MEEYKPFGAKFTIDIVNFAKRKHALKSDVTLKKVHFVQAIIKTDAPGVLSMVEISEVNSVQID